MCVPFSDLKPACQELKLITEPEGIGVPSKDLAGVCNFHWRSTSGPSFVRQPGAYASWGNLVTLFT